MIRTAALPLTAITALLASPFAFALTPPAAPATVNTNAERAAWTALMSPDGEYAAVAAYRKGCGRKAHPLMGGMDSPRRPIGRPC